MAFDPFSDGLAVETKRSPSNAKEFDPFAEGLAVDHVPRGGIGYNVNPVWAKQIAAERLAEREKLAGRPDSIEVAPRGTTFEDGSAFRIRGLGTQNTLGQLARGIAKSGSVGLSQIPEAIAEKFQSPEQKKEWEATKEQHPLSENIGEILGQIPLAMIGGSGAIAPKTLGGKALAGAKIGGGLGLTHGLSTGAANQISGEGTLGDTISEGATEGIAGTIIGSSIPLAIAGASKAGQGILHNLPFGVKESLLKKRQYDIGSGKLDTGLRRTASDIYSNLQNIAGTKKEGLFQKGFEEKTVLEPIEYLNAKHSDIATKNADEILPIVQKEIDDLQAQKLAALESPEASIILDTKPAKEVIDKSVYSHPNFKSQEAGLGKVDTSKYTPEEQSIAEKILKDSRKDKDELAKELSIKYARPTTRGEAARRLDDINHEMDVLFNNHNKNGQATFAMVLKHDPEYAALNDLRKYYSDQSDLFYKAALGKDFNPNRMLGSMGELRDTLRSGITRASEMSRTWKPISGVDVAKSVLTNYKPAEAAAVAKLGSGFALGNPLDRFNRDVQKMFERTKSAPVPKALSEKQIEINRFKSGAETIPQKTMRLAKEGYEEAQKRADMINKVETEKQQFLKESAQRRKSLQKFVLSEKAKEVVAKDLALKEARDLKLKNDTRVALSKLEDAKTQAKLMQEIDPSKTPGWERLDTEKKPWELMSPYDKETARLAALKKIENMPGYSEEYHRYLAGMEHKPTGAQAITSAGGSSSQRALSKVSETPLGKIKGSVPSISKPAINPIDEPMATVRDDPMKRKSVASGKRALLKKQLQDEELSAKQSSEEAVQRDIEEASRYGTESKEGSISKEEYEFLQRAAEEKDMVDQFDAEELANKNAGVANAPASLPGKKQSGFASPKALATVAALSTSVGLAPAAVKGILATYGKSDNMDVDQLKAILQTPLGKKIAARFSGQPTQ